jgi:hypothetical protein
MLCNAVTFGLALNVAGVIAPLGDLANPQVGVHHGSVEGVIEHFKAPGEQICAFQYRKAVEPKH